MKSVICICYLLKKSIVAFRYRTEAHTIHSVLISYFDQLQRSQTASEPHFVSTPYPKY